MAKDENVLQTLLKVKKVGGDRTEALLFDVLSKCDNKTDLIKNALFNYIVNIQNGNIIDRAYPYNMIDRFLDISTPQSVYAPYPPRDSLSTSVISSLAPQEEDGSSQDQYNEDKTDNEDEVIDEELEEVEDEEEEDYEDDNMDVF